MNDRLKQLIVMVLMACTAFSATYAEGEWRDLFDGKSLKGWVPQVEGQQVEVKDGEIQMLAIKKNLWLLNDQEFKNFELEVEVNMPEEGYNSGIGFRCAEGTKKISGYQCEVANEKTGSIYAIGKGWVLPADKDGWGKFISSANGCFKKGEWNKIKIRCEGPRIQIWINGHQTADVTDDKYQSGKIALQHHGKGDLHRFKNVRIREI